MKERDGSLGYAWYVVGILTLAYTFSYIDRQILNLLVDPIRTDLGISDTQISLLQGLAFALFYTFMGLPIARLADRSSRRVIIGTGVAVWSLMTALCGLARSFGGLFFARVGVGVGEAALNPAAYSMITDYFPKDQVTRAIAVYTSGSFLGAGLAYIIGGYVIELVANMEAIVLPVVGELRAWQVAFIAVGLPGLLVSAVIFTLREPKRRGLLASASGVNRGIPIPEVLRFLRSQWRTYALHFSGISAIVLLAYAMLAWTPTFFIRVHGWTAGQAGMVYGTVVLVFGTGGVVSAGWLADMLRRRGHSDANLRLVALSSLILVPLGIVGFLMPGPWLALLFIAPSCFLWAIPMGIGPAALQPITPNQMRAQVSSLYLLTITLVGLGIGPLAVALLTDYAFGDPKAVRYSLCIVAAIGAPLAAYLLYLGMPFYRASLEAAERGWREAGQG